MFRTPSVLRLSLAAVRAGLPGYRIKTASANGDLMPSPEQSEYFPVLYSSREKPGSRIYGLNLNDGGLRQQTLEHARDVDHLATSVQILYSIAGRAIETGSS